MKVFLRAVLLAMTMRRCVVVSGLTLAAFGPCMAACLTATFPAATLVPGIGEAGAVAACAVSCACFKEDTTVETHSGTQKMAELTVGDEVRTLDNGRTVWTKLLNIYKFHGDFEFVTLKTESRSITVTLSHPVYVRTIGQDLKREAGDVSVGDFLLQSSGGGEAASAVVDITKSHDTSKVIIDTEQGSVLADGVLAGTSKGNEIRDWKGWANVDIAAPVAFLTKLDKGTDGKLPLKELSSSSMQLTTPVSAGQDQFEARVA